MNFLTRFLDLVFAKASEANEIIKGLRETNKALATERDNYKALYEATKAGDADEAAKLETAIAQVEAITFEDMPQNPTPITDAIIEAVTGDEATDIEATEIEGVGEMVETSDEVVIAVKDAIEAAIASE